MLHAPGEVCNIFTPSSVTLPFYCKSNYFYDFTPSYPSFNEVRRGRGEEVSDPPFSVPRTSRLALSFTTPFTTLLSVGGVAHLCVTARFIPAGRLE